MNQGNNSYVELHIPDFELAKEFYGELGFEVEWEKEPGDADGYLVMEHQDNILCFYGGEEEVHDHSYFQDFSDDSKRGYGVEIALMVEDIEEFFERAVEIADIQRELEERPWGLKDFRFEDPFGFYIRVSEPHDIREE